VNIRTHVDDPENPEKPVTRWARPGFGYGVENAVFSRDCLVVDLDFDDNHLTLLVNHFKAQESGEGAARAAARRRKQAARVAELVKETKTAHRMPIVLGDFNIDTSQAGYDGSLDPLFVPGLLYDPIVHVVDEKERWTHYYAGGNKVSRLDYILIDPKLKDKVAKLEIFRQGLTTKCKNYKGPRFPTVGPEHTEASDHCPMTLTLALET
jgi:endonuclease/exonuclease/phosphatase family metal-dependent hydrolase